ncbi:coiled-coil domain-containing protein 159 isoform X2 [Paroedura picta]
MMTVATEKRSRALSPSWFLSGAGSTASSGQLVRSASKPPGIIPEFQLMLKNELELIKAQLCAQTKAFEALSHSVTLLEQESRHQQGRIAQMEEELKFAVSSSRETTLEGLMQRRLQEAWKALAAEVKGLHGSMSQKDSSMETLSQEVLESKKFLWEELEAVQAELRHIHQKLKDQDVDITRNLVSIKKMRENQARYTKFLAQLKGRVSGDASDTADSEPGNEEAWPPVNNPLPSGSIWSDKRGLLRVKLRGGHHSRKGAPSGSYLSDSALR